MLDATIEGRHVNLFKKVIILLKKKGEGNHCSHCTGSHVLNIWVEYNEAENCLVFTLHNVSTSPVGLLSLVLDYSWVSLDGLQKWDAASWDAS